jgi:hypothetical protein
MRRYPRQILYTRSISNITISVLQTTLTTRSSDKNRKYPALRSSGSWEGSTPICTGSVNGRWDSTAATIEMATCTARRMSVRRARASEPTSTNSSSTLSRTSIESGVSLLGDGAWQDTCDYLLACTLRLEVDRLTGCFLSLASTQNILGLAATLPNGARYFQ